MSHKRYEKISFIGEGQFATVYKARDKETDKEVAIKKIKIGNIQEAQDGVNRTALREIKLLQELHHDNVIALIDVYGKDSSISLVFEIMETDLEQILHEQKLFFTFAHIKTYILMTLRGLEYLHKNFILHRDLKPNNLLLDRNNILKIADFGLARTFGSPSRIYTHQVVTRWYRAPELLYGARMYGTGVDMWAVGCILAELYRREPLFPGDSDLDTLDRIVTLCGTPTEKNWHGVTELPDFVEFNDPSDGVPFSRHFSACDEHAIKILESMLRLCPSERCTATEALKMPYFTTEPFPADPKNLPRAKSEKASRDDQEDEDEDTSKGREPKAEERSGNGDTASAPPALPRLTIKLESIDESKKPPKAKRLKFD